MSRTLRTREVHDKMTEYSRLSPCNWCTLSQDRHMTKLGLWGLPARTCQRGFYTPPLPTGCRDCFPRQVGCCTSSTNGDPFSSRRMNYRLCFAEKKKTPMFAKVNFKRRSPTQSISLKGLSTASLHLPPIESTTSFTVNGVHGRTASPHHCHNKYMRQF